MFNNGTANTISPAPTRGPTPTLRAQSGTPATLGGFRPREAALDQSRAENDFEASTTMSDMDDDLSQSATYDYGAGEEASEYIPPTTPKVGGFGVGTAKVQAANKSRPAEDSSNARQDWDRPGRQEYKNRKGLDSAEGESWGANFWCIIEQPVSARLALQDDLLELTHVHREDRVSLPTLRQEIVLGLFHRGHLSYHLARKDSGGSCLMRSRIPDG